MTDLDRLQQRAAWAPRGLKRKREAELRAARHEQLREEVEAGLSRLRRIKETAQFWAEEAKEWGA